MLKNNLKKIRLVEYQYTSAEMAKKLGLAKSTYCQYEKESSKPNLELAFQISFQLGKKVDDIWYMI